jgi:hypothetical protein
MNPPRVFITYSHDSAEHKGWVLDFATTLRNRGVDAVLDQWDLKPGDDVPHFMETQLQAADYVLMICTENYVKKANAGEGGVGYEKMIITSTLLAKIDSSKVIPIIRQNGSDIRPTFLQTKLYVNFSNDEDAEYKFDDLLRVLLNAPLYEKPEIGKDPFQSMSHSRPDRQSDGVKEVMHVVAECFEQQEYDWVLYKTMLRHTSMHKFTLDKYIELAITQGLLNWRSENAISITQKGIAYLETHNIIQG